MFSHPLASVVVTVAPQADPVTLQALKDHLRITHGEQDVYLQGLLQTAIARLQALANVCFLTQTLEIAFDGAPTGELRLPREPIQSITSVTVYDTSDVASVWSSAAYIADLTHAPPRLFLASSGALPSGLRARRSVVVTCVAGWTSVAAVPLTLAHALLALVAVWYAAPATVGAVPDQVMALLPPYPRWGLA